MKGSTAIARGKQLFDANCAFCHGSHAQGGEIGPDLLTSPIVLKDRNGEEIAKVVQDGLLRAKGMPVFQLNDTEVADIADFLHSMQPAGSKETGKELALIPGGNPQAGKRFFYGAGGCSSCHSVTGDLAGIGKKFRWRALQNLIVTGGSTGMLGTRLPNAAPRTVLITFPSGSVVKGRLVAIDDFDVTLVTASGSRITIPRHGRVPKVKVYDPYAAHYDLLKDGKIEMIHDLTAYLESVK